MISRLGRRGSVLLLFGVAWLLYGLAILTSSHPHVMALLGWAPMAVWGVGWCVCGLIGVAFSLMPTGPDTPGFAAVFLPPALWSASFLWSSIVASVWHTADGRAWFGTGIWTAAALLVYITAGWPEPTGGR